MEKKDIYEYFAELFGCYVSDLRMNHQADWDAKLVCAVPEEQFSIKEWNDFVSYVCGERLEFHHIEQVKECLINSRCRHRETT